MSPRSWSSTPGPRSGRPSSRSTTRSAPRSSRWRRTSSIASISFDSQVPGDAERLLKLAVLNGALSSLEAIAFVRGLTPLFVYHELCRLVGQLAIFSETRRPPGLPQYDHEDLGGCFYAVIKYDPARARSIAPSAFEKRYFERNGERLQVQLEPDWLGGSRTLFLGVETELATRSARSSSGRWT